MCTSTPPNPGKKKSDTNATRCLPIPSHTLATPSTHKQTHREKKRERGILTPTKKSTETRTTPEVDSDTRRANKKPPSGTNHTGHRIGRIASKRASCSTQYLLPAITIFHAYHIFYSMTSSKAPLCHTSETKRDTAIHWRGGDSAREK